MDSTSTSATGRPWCAGALDLQMAEGEPARRSGGLKELPTDDCAVTHIASCVTRENSCTEGEESRENTHYSLYSLDEEGAEMWRKLSERSAASAGAVRAIGEQLAEEQEYPFYDDDDEDEDGPPFTATAQAPEGLGLEGSDEALPPMTHRLSVGSALHGTGQCRPCAWFWKPGGCENAENCRHCHECPQGELLRRKKARVREIRRGNADDVRRALSDRAFPEAACHQGPPGLFGAAAAVPPLMAAARSMPVRPCPPGLMLQETLPPALVRPPPGLEEVEPIAVHSTASTPDARALQAFMARLPSEGSSLHAAGLCKPCAWFWKPGGCQNGQACSHCHLCPPGELVARKRTKEAAIKAGLIERRGLNDRGPRAMRISSLLQVP